MFSVELTYSTLTILKKINRWRSQFCGLTRFLKSKKILKSAFFRNENKVDFVLENRFTFANRKIRTGTIKTKVLLYTGWSYW